jgi:hypothetical protein
MIAKSAPNAKKRGSFFARKHFKELKKQANAAIALVDTFGRSDLSLSQDAKLEQYFADFLDAAMHAPRKYIGPEFSVRVEKRNEQRKNRQQKKDVQHRRGSAQEEHEEPLEELLEAEKDAPEGEEGVKIPSKITEYCMDLAGRQFGKEMDVESRAALAEDFQDALADFNSRVDSSKKLLGAALNKKKTAKPNRPPTDESFTRNGLPQVQVNREWGSAEHQMAQYSEVEYDWVSSKSRAAQFMLFEVKVATRQLFYHYPLCDRILNKPLGAGQNWLGWPEPVILKRRRFKRRVITPTALLNGTGFDTTTVLRCPSNMQQASWIIRAILLFVHKLGVVLLWRTVYSSLVNQEFDYYSASEGMGRCIHREKWISVLFTWKASEATMVDTIYFYGYIFGTLQFVFQCLISAKSVLSLCRKRRSASEEDDEDDDEDDEVGGSCSCCSSKRVERFQRWLVDFVLQLKGHFLKTLVTCGPYVVGAALVSVDYVFTHFGPAPPPEFFGFDESTSEPYIVREDSSGPECSDLFKENAVGYAAIESIGFLFVYVLVRVFSFFFIAIVLLYLAPYALLYLFVTWVVEPVHNMAVNLGMDVDEDDDDDDDDDQHGWIMMVIACPFRVAKAISLALLLWWFVIFAGAVFLVFVSPDGLFSPGDTASASAGRCVLHATREC